ncbi:MAG: Ig-like domain-containing protein [Limisphaerales bacterium]
MNKELLLTCFVTSALAFGTHLRAQSATATGPFVEILATDPTALEGTSSGAFTLVRNGDTNAELTVYVEILGTASNGVDYALITNAIVIPTNYLAVDIPVLPLIDTTNRGNKTVVLKIETNANYLVGGGRSAEVTIIDDIFNTPLPTVTITDPTNGSTFAFPADITLTANASDPGASIQSVSFYANDDFLGRVTNSPYTLPWTKARAGHYTLFARAVDNLDQSSLSPLVQITVTDVLPVVAITTPTNGASFTAHQNIPIAADVTDANASATIASVAFYDNGRLIATTTNAPYQVVWSNAPAGLYSLQAAATDNVGQRAYSKGVLINISRP